MWHPDSRIKNPHYTLSARTQFATHGCVRITAMFRLDELNELEEVYSRLSERAKQWPQRWKQEGWQEGRQEGEEHRALQVARNMLERTSMDDATIADLTGLPLEAIQKLRTGPRH